jgi:hypothetical protein
MMTLKESALKGKVLLIPDRRTEERQPSPGAVTLQLTQQERVLMAEIVDVHSGGFRVRYKGTPLTVGSDVCISHPCDTLMATVVWLQVAGDCCELGLQIKRTGNR